MASYIGWSILAAFGAFVLVTLLRAAFFRVKKEPALPPLAEEAADEARAAQHLSGAVRIPTISYPEDERIDWEQFARFRAYLEESYPLIHKHLTREVPFKASVLYHWKGKNPGLLPIALLSHQDVVPVTPGTEGDWTHPPFSGHNDGEFIWGRGAIDMKNHLICVMEAVETLLEEGYVPERDVYLCFGHDEEVVAAGDSGARNLRLALEARGVTRLESTLDEGGAVLPIHVKGVIENAMLAGIGISEKGYADFEITVNHKGGHSAQPPNHSALGELAGVIRDLEGHQFKAKMLPYLSGIMDAAGRRMPYYLRVVTVNHKLLRPLLTAVMKRIPPAACMIRTTTAVTQASGSPAANVLPQKASVVANFRMMPGITTADVAQHIRRVCRNKNIDVRVLKSVEASPFSGIDTPSYASIRDQVLAGYPGAIVTPYLVMGGTDTIYYEPICDHCYRYSPFYTDLSILLTAHATNERVPVAILGDAVRFFKRYIRDAAGEY